MINRVYLELIVIPSSSSDQHYKFVRHLYFDFKLNSEVFTLLKFSSEVNVYSKVTKAVKVISLTFN